MPQSFQQLRYHHQLPDTFNLTLPPLHRAIQHGDPHIASHVTSLLNEYIQGGFNVDERDIFQQTALFQAAERGQEDMFRTLLQHGADTSIRDIIGRSILEVAARSGSLPIVKCLIEEKEASVDEQLSMWGSTPLQAAIESGSIELIQYLLQHEPLVSIQRYDGQSAITLATQRGFTAVVNQLEEMMDTQARYWAIHLAGENRIT
jgi:ankyrin repeat protein